MVKLDIQHRPLVIGNWKMNGTIAASAALVSALVAELGTETSGEVVLCPPFTALSTVRAHIDGTAVKLGAQNGFPGTAGAFTGEISMAMLRDAGCSYVLVGHSERRQHCHETEGLVARKMLAAVEHGLIPVLCVGESAEIRQRDDGETTVLAQLASALEGLPEDAEFVVAYEPLWAIGTGAAATAADAQAMVSHIRSFMSQQRYASWVQRRILYGGSVTSDNIADFTAQKAIDGVLVGGASLVAATFVAVVRGALRGYQCTDK